MRMHASAATTDSRAECLPGLGRAGGGLALRGKERQLGGSGKLLAQERKACVHGQPTALTKKLVAFTKKL